jgi:hypothetical protein
MAGRSERAVLLRALAWSEARRAGRDELVLPTDDDAFGRGNETFAVRTRCATAGTRSCFADDEIGARNQRIKWREEVTEVVDVAAGNNNRNTAREQRLDRYDCIRGEEMNLIDGDEGWGHWLGIDECNDVGSCPCVAGWDSRSGVGHERIDGVAGIAFRLDNDDDDARIACSLHTMLQFCGLPREHRTADDGEGGHKAVITGKAGDGAFETSPKVLDAALSVGAVGCLAVRRRGARGRRACIVGSGVVGGRVVGGRVVGGRVAVH